MSGSLHRTARVISVIAGTLVALSCGTNGVAGNLGMYAMGIPMGLLTDARGPRLVALIGSICLGLGYFPIYMAYHNGQGSMPVVFLCLFAFLTGMGSCSAFGGSIKTAASNFPEHRGTATAFPMAAFGLSALFWSNLSALIFKDDTGHFLLLLALGTSILSFASIPFLRILASEAYSSVPHNSHESSDLRPVPEDSELPFENEQYPAHARSHSVASNSQGRAFANDDETATLVSKNDQPRPSFDTLDDDFLDEVAMEAHQTDIRGLAMLRKVEFWQLFLTMALLSGIGLMTINNIGNSVKALWLYYDDSATDLFIQHRQVMHVSILSFGNFLGRLFSGIGSDLLVKKLGMSRIWCLFLSAVVFTLTQLAGTTISNPNSLVVVSGFTGIAYGFLFGVFPSLTAHTFGIGGLSQNWGVMTLAPVFSGNVFNLLYGNIYDGHSVVGHDGDRECPDGLACYRSAYFMTFVSGLFGIAVCLWAIVRERNINNAMSKKLDHRLA
ncbi:unnamed protein product [Penicillium nalgiovense]|nr:unnamed protein product [Penicillium nalgiovense]CAG7968210.1 unnamed protein product [Penicillium nalgiovense]CAG8055756.1 unnamed protein product [Penicillium nalgiovense]CAG8204875.1 unnamed protein product [Penicillium nalgiovense]CAG8216550.1 unnamed protein product [Penicillium nalgiovense]